jgi:hypothetical protein
MVPVRSALLRSPPQSIRLGCQRRKQSRRLTGSGSQLASLLLPVTETPQTPYSQWASIGVTFNGIAKSVVFGGSANVIAFDDITLGSPTAGDGSNQSVPDSGSTMMLMGLALGAIGGIRHKLKL